MSEFATVHDVERLTILTARGKPLCDEPVILGSADLGPESPQVVILTLDRDDGLAGAPVKTVFGRRVNQTRHNATLSDWWSQNGMYRFAHGEWAAPPNVGG